MSFTTSSKFGAGPAALVACALLALASACSQDGVDHSATKNPEVAEAAVVADEAVDSAGPLPGATSPASTDASLARGERKPVQSDTLDPAVAGPGVPPHVAEMRKPYENLGPVESRYFDAKFVNQNATLAAMRKRDFDSEVLDLARDGDGESLQRQQLYQEQLAASLEPFAKHGATLGRVGCARVMCFATIRANSYDWVSPWTMLLRELPLPMPSLATMPVKTSTGIELRVVFTTAGSGGFSSRN